uniref:hypothetical protein n=1 Tax=Oceanobacillus massiliensis TaxID=1465765 RepID=UPI003017CBD0
SDTESQKSEKLTKIDNIYKYCEHYLSRLTVKPSTMYSMLSKMGAYGDVSEIKLMQILHKTQKETFVNSFKMV